jgi:hypothetical protein
MRSLSDHIVSSDQVVQLKIEVLDDPGAGGANHRYLITWTPQARALPTIAELEEILAKDPSGGEALTLENQAAAAGRCGIAFQNGPIKEAGVNGITQEALLAIVIDRLRSFQAGPFACRENAIALTKCEEALMWLQRRTVARIKRGVEGTNQK